MPEKSEPDFLGKAGEHAKKILTISDGGCAAMGDGRSNAPEDPQDAKIPKMPAP